MIYSIINHKAQVGKTTSTINIGAALVEKEKKVLLVDLDPQSNLTKGLGIKKFEISIYDNLCGEKMINTIDYKKNISVLPSSLELSLAEITLNTDPGKEHILQDILTPLKKKFDYILIDCPPSLGFLTINALVASQFIIIPIHAEFLSLTCLPHLTNMIDKIRCRLNKNLEIKSVFLTQLNKSKIFDENAKESIQDFFGDRFFTSSISFNVALSESLAQCKDIFLYNKNCKGAQEYRQLCNEMIMKKVFK